MNMTVNENLLWKALEEFITNEEAEQKKENRFIPVEFRGVCQSILDATIERLEDGENADDTMRTLRSLVYYVFRFGRYYERRSKANTIFH